MIQREHFEKTNAFLSSIKNQDGVIQSDNIVNLNVQNKLKYMAYSFHLDKESALRTAQYLQVISNSKCLEMILGTKDFIPYSK